MRAAALRMLAADAVQAANSGHPGMPLGLADVMTVLVERHLKFYSGAPDWPDRDRLILSAGHGSMLLYAMLSLSGYADFGIEQLKNFRQLGSMTPGHPEYHKGSGVETTTGPLGQGLANAVGFAIAEAFMQAKFGDSLVDHATYVIVGDGCLMEGVSHEAIGLAGHLGLSKLIVLWDDNNITIDGEVGLADSCHQLQRFQASGWNVGQCDGHDPASIDRAISEARQSDGPALVACKTRIGFGAPTKEGQASAHGAPLGDAEIAGLREALGWDYPPFEIPKAVCEQWQAIGSRGAEAYRSWIARRDTMPEHHQREFNRMLSGAMSSELQPAIDEFKSDIARSRPGIATRKASELILSQINPLIPEHIGGSADLTGSNNTKTSDLGVFERTSRSGRYLHYGIREHAMAAAMNGMALHGGIRPYGGTFLCFADYAKPAIRLSALMQLPVTYVMTHDSIGLGEDGPTHQPIEHLAMLRSLPDLQVIRPCDPVETAEAWQIALESCSKPTVIALSRQSVPTVRCEQHTTENLSRLGAYVLDEAVASDLQAVLIATGSEVALAMAAKAQLEAEGIGVRVVSMPCQELFQSADDDYRRKVLPPGPVRVAVEAACSFGWDRWLCGEGGSEQASAFVGIETFGASAPAEDLFSHFGITADEIVRAVRNLLDRR